MLASRGEIACARFACHAMSLRGCAALPLVTAIGDQDFLEHAGVSRWAIRIFLLMFP
jgi:hypothetical protein